MILLVPSVPGSVTSDLPTLPTNPKCTEVHSSVLKRQQAFGLPKDRAAHIFLFAGESKHIFEELLFHVFKSFTVFCFKIKQCLATDSARREISILKSAKIPLDLKCICIFLTNILPGIINFDMTEFYLGILKI